MVVLQLQVVLHIMRLAEGCCGRMFTQVDCELLQPEASAAGWGLICSVQATLPVEGCCGALPRVSALPPTAGCTRSL